MLPNVSKIFEKVMVSQLSEYSDPLLNPNISGFRQGHSCESVLTKLVSDIQCPLDQGMYVCIILMDLSKAFNCIPHKLLIAKFEAYGVSDSACSLLLSYFRDRQQRVKIGVYLDNELSFNHHVSTICKKAGKQLNVLIRLSHVIDKQSKMLLYNTFIKSHFQFCSLIWHFCNHMNIFKMEKIQQRALQQVCLDYDSTYVDLLESTCTSPLLLQRYRKLMEFVFKVIHVDAPGYFKDIFKFKKCESFRDENRLDVPSYNRPNMVKIHLRMNV